VLVKPAQNEHVPQPGAEGAAPTSGTVAEKARSSGEEGISGGMSTLSNVLYGDSTSARVLIIAIHRAFVWFWGGAQHGGIVKLSEGS